MTRADLPEPTTDAGRVGLAALLAEPGSALLGLDFDGTLAPIVPDPDAARGHPDVPRVLTRLAAAGIRVAVVTGRPAATAVEYAGIADVPGLVVLGHYGLERWEGGTLTAPEDLSAVAEARRRLPEVLAAAGAPEGTYVEDKGAAVAVHTRRTADPSAAFDAAPRPAGRAGRRGRAGGRAGPVRARAAAGRRRQGRRAADPGRGGAAFGGRVRRRRPRRPGRLRRGRPAPRDGTPGLLVCSGSTEVTALADRADLVVDGPDGVVDLLMAVAEALDG